MRSTDRIEESLFGEVKVALLLGSLKQVGEDSVGALVVLVSFEDIRNKGEGFLLFCVVAGPSFAEFVHFFEVFDDNRLLAVCDTSLNQLTEDVQFETRLFLEEVEVDKKTK